MAASGTTLKHMHLTLLIYSIVGNSLKNTYGAQGKQGTENTTESMVVTMTGDCRRTNGNGNGMF